MKLSEISHDVDFDNSIKELDKQFIIMKQHHVKITDDDVNQWLHFHFVNTIINGLLNNELIYLPKSYQTFINKYQNNINFKLAFELFDLEKINWLQLNDTILKDLKEVNMKFKVKNDENYIIIKNTLWHEFLYSKVLPIIFKLKKKMDGINNTN